MNRQNFDYPAARTENNPFRVNPPLYIIRAMRADNYWSCHNFETRVKQWAHRRMRAIGERRETPEEENKRVIKEMQQRVFVGPPRRPHVYSN